VTGIFNVHYILIWLACRLTYPNLIFHTENQIIWGIYLAVVQDRWTAEILGARVMKNHCKELVIDTFQDALLKHETSPEYFHSDQGSEYESKDFKSLLTTHSIKISNSPKASPWRNGSQESFFGRFKVEFGDFDRFDTLEELMVGIYQYIFYYNQERIHTRLRCSPRSYRQQYELLKSSIVPHLTPPIHNHPLPPNTRQQLPTELTVLRDLEGLTVNSIDNCSPPPLLGHPTGADFIIDFSRRSCLKKGVLDNGHLTDPGWHCEKE
jgi:hypothetical protein